MGLIVDIRKYNIDNVIGDLVDASRMKKNWLGKTTDDYWNYLDRTTESLKINLNAYVVSDFFVFLIEERQFKELLNSYVKTLTENRKSFVSIILLDDKEFLLREIKKPTFIFDFENFCRELNGEYYHYNLDLLGENVREIVSILERVDSDHSLIINIC